MSVGGRYAALAVTTSLVFSAWLAVATTAQAKPLRNGVIAYAVQRCYDPNQTLDCSSRVRTVGPRGRVHSRLPCSDGPVRRCFDRYPRFSPGGRRLATVNDAEVADNYVSIRTLRGQVLSRLLVRDGVSDFAWGPQGDVFAVNDFERIWFLERSSGEFRQYRRTGGVDVAWSRQGRLAWTNEPAGGLMVADRRRRVRRYNVRGGASRPDWSPDGRRLAFLSVIRGAAYIINANGTGRRLLNRRCAATTLSSLAWSPDGRRVACDTDNGDLLSVDVRTRRARALVRNIYPLDIDWQPRGG